MSQHQVIQELREASKQRIRIKRMAMSLSLKHRTKLALKKEKAGEVKAADYIQF